MRNGRIGRIGTLVGLCLALAVGVAPSAGATGGLVEPRPVANLAHAGGDYEAPHSTLYAMRRAVEAGADIIDLDLRLSADGIIMVQHDDAVDRLTADTGPVTAYTAAQLQAMDNAYWFVPNCWSCRDRDPAEYRLRGVRTGTTPPPPGATADEFGIPTLAQVVERFPDRRLNVEIKDGIPGAEALAAFVATHGPADRYIVLSFDDATVQRFHELAPAVPVGPGLQTVTAWFGSRGPLPGYQYLEVPPVYGAIEVVTPQFVADAHAAGLRVYVWFNGTEDDVPEVWQRLLAMGVDGLDTARPAAAEPYIAAENARRAALAAASTTTTTSPGAQLPATGGSAAPWVASGLLLVGAGLVLRRFPLRP